MVRRTVAVQRLVPFGLVHGAALLVAVLLVAAPLALPAQVVRGTATERESGTAVAGVVVSLERLPTTGGRPDSIVNALTNATGGYALRAPGAGRYRISAKRIGVERYNSAEFLLGVGETRRVDVVLERATLSLPPVTVVANDMCVTRSGQLDRVASLWDEAQAALLATQISERDRLVSANVYHYRRTLVPRTLRILDETRTEVSGLVERPFVSLSGDSLSRSGYWSVSEDTSTYFAPDAAVLLSPVFRKDHCFSLASGRRDRSGMTGLAFEPARGRRGAEIRGTIWLDARTFALRLVEFQYTGLPAEAAAANAGGELRFARLPNGAWVVRRWFIRMPGYAQFVSFTSAASGVPPEKTQTLGVNHVGEDGAQVFAPGIQYLERLGSISGTVLDSSGHPMSTAMVRLGGSPFRIAAGDDGRFHFDSLPSGGYALLAEDAGYAALGLYAADQSLDLQEGASARVTLRAARTAEIVERLCGGRAPGKGRAVLRLTMIDVRTRRPLSKLPTHVYWQEGPASRAADDTLPNHGSVSATAAGTAGIQNLTDANGVVTFCGVPSETRLLIRPLLPSMEAGALAARCTLQPNEVAVRSVATTRPTVAAELFFPDTLSKLPLCRPASARPDTASTPPPRPTRRAPASRVAPPPTRVSGSGSPSRARRRP